MRGQTFLGKVQALATCARSSVAIINPSSEYAHKAAVEVLHSAPFFPARRGLTNHDCSEPRSRDYKTPSFSIKMCRFWAQGGLVLTGVLI